MPNSPKIVKNLFLSEMALITRTERFIVNCIVHLNVIGWMNNLVGEVWMPMDVQNLTTVCLLDMMRILAMGLYFVHFIAIPIVPLMKCIVPLVNRKTVAGVHPTVRLLQLLVSLKFFKKFWFYLTWYLKGPNGQECPGFCPEVCPEGAMYIPGQEDGNGCPTPGQCMFA